MTLPKFIITMDGFFRLGMVNQHKDLLKPGDSCLGGGYYHFDYTTNRSHFYKARPTVFISYKGGNNRKAGHFYADRRVVKPTPKAPAARPANNGSTWRVTNAGNAHRSSATVRANGHSRSATSGDALLAKNGNRQMAMNTNRNGNGNSHFGGRR